MKWLWAVWLMALIGYTPADAASGQAGFTCSETVTTAADGTVTPVHQAWAEAMMVFDFDRKLGFPGRGTGSYPIRKIAHRRITWQSEHGGLKPILTRGTLKAGDFRLGSSTLAHR